MLFVCRECRQPCYLDARKLETNPKACPLSLTLVTWKRFKPRKSRKKTLERLVQKDGHFTVRLR